MTAHSHFYCASSFASGNTTTIPHHTSASYDNTSLAPARFDCWSLALTLRPPMNPVPIASLTEKRFRLQSKNGCSETVLISQQYINGFLGPSFDADIGRCFVCTTRTRYRGVYTYKQYMLILGMLILYEVPKLYFVHTLIYSYLNYHFASLLKHFSCILGSGVSSSISRNVSFLIK